ncbi:hypothetical protein EXIGLDRAFT_694293, partial [Exidia glandulosa HHB12029]
LREVHKRVPFSISHGCEGEHVYPSLGTVVAPSCGRSQIVFAAKNEEEEGEAQIPRPPRLMTEPVQKRTCNKLRAEEEGKDMDEPSGSPGVWEGRPPKHARFPPGKVDTTAAH